MVKGDSNGTKNDKKSSPTKHSHHPIFREKLTFGQKSADVIAKFGGSWMFIIIVCVILIIWIIFNSWLLIKVSIAKPFDPYPYILLNLTLSCLAAIQAPVILMSQNRQAQRDHIDAKYDHQINRKAEREIQMIQKELAFIKRKIGELTSKQVRQFQNI